MRYTSCFGDQRSLGACQSEFFMSLLLLFFSAFSGFWLLTFLLNKKQICFRKIFSRAMQKFVFCQQMKRLCGFWSASCVSFAIVWDAGSTGRMGTCSWQERQIHWISERFPWRHKQNERSAGSAEHSALVSRSQTRGFQGARPFFPCKSHALSSGVCSASAFERREGLRRSKEIRDPVAYHEARVHSCSRNVRSSSQIAASGSAVARLLCRASRLLLSVSEESDVAALASTCTRCAGFVSVAWRVTWGDRRELFPLGGGPRSIECPRIG